MLFRPISPRKRRKNVSAISKCKRGASADAPLAFHIVVRLATGKRPFRQKFFNRNNSDGSSTTTNNAGKMNSTSGKTILTGARSASAFAA